MNYSSEGTQSVNKYKSHPYPLVRSGGLFLVLIGAGIIIDVVLNGAFIVGTALAMISLMFAKVLSFGKPTRIQVVALVFAIVLEIVLFIILANVLPEDIAFPVRLMWILIIVGMHFLPMAVCFGPRFAIAGILCIINGFVGLMVSEVSSDLFLLVDGVLKFGFGSWILKNP